MQKAKIFIRQSLLSFVLSISFFCAHAQKEEFTFSPLGQDVYKERIAFLEKYKPQKLYKDKTQQWIYEEMIKGRTSSQLEMFKKGGVVVDKLLIEKATTIFKKIAAANPGNGLDTVRLYLSRDLTANAACWGEGSVFINLGLFFWLDNDDEFALVVAHELAHQVMKHSDQQMQQHISKITADEFKEELKSIRKSSYGRYTKEKELYRGLQTESGKHSRFKESEADTIAVKFIRNAGFNPINGAKVLLKLDHVQDIFTSDKLYDLKKYLSPAQVDITSLIKKTKYNGLSSVKVEMSADKAFDTIRTHPDCDKRFTQITGKPAPANTACCTKLTSDYDLYKQRAMVELVRTMYESYNYTMCAHLCFMALENNYPPAFYNNMLSMCFSQIYYYDTQLRRFWAVNCAAERASNMKQLQDYLFAVSNPDLIKLAEYYKSVSGETASEDFNFADMIFQTKVKGKDATAAFAAFNRKFPNSKYFYLTKTQDQK